MASLDFDAEKIAFKELYAQDASLFSEAVDSFRTLVALLLADNDSFPTPTVTGRLKDREECIQKFARKYQTKCEESKTPYEIRAYITDLIGVRAVCLYGDDIPKVREVIADNFEIRHETDKSQFLEASEATFGYKGLHLDLALKDNRKALPEYRRFREMVFELQIRTIAQDAWSTIDHKIKYKKEIPHYLKRRINRLAALFELADQEFQHIREDTHALEKRATEGTEAREEAIPAVDGAGSANAPAPLDAFSFLSLMKTRHPNYQFAPHKIDGFVGEIRELDPDLSPASFSDALATTDSQIQSYKDYQATRFLNRLNPYTTVRHALYLANKDKFGSLLFDHQRRNFDEWLTKREGASSEA